MKFNPHSELAGSHSYLSASTNHWLNYNDEKFDATYQTRLAAMKGTQLHELAAMLIKMGVKLARSSKTLNLYVNDAIGYRMDCEVVLFYSRNAFGTADAISFRKKPGSDMWLLRIHDLKTGVNPTTMRQLEVYAAYFCLEYGYKPAEIEIELRIYQNDEVKIHFPDYDDVTKIMGRITYLDDRIESMKAEAQL